MSTEEDGVVLVHEDAFGGRVYRVEFDAQASDTTEDDAPEASDLPDDEEAEEDAEEAKAAASTSHAFLVIHPSGDEVWTRTGVEFAKEILAHRGPWTRNSSPSLFDSL